MLIYGLLWLPPVQQKTKDFALKEVMKMTKNQMSIGNFYFRPFNKLKLEDVYVADLRGDTLIYAEKIAASFDLFKLLDDQLLIKGIELDNFVANIYQDSIDSDFNFQFLIDAFASEEEQDTTSSNMIIQIHDVKLKRGRINYDIFSETNLPIHEFDFNHIHLYDIAANLDLSSIDLDKLDVSLSKFTLKESSGFHLTEAKTKVKSKNKRIILSDLSLKLPSSEVSLPEAWVDYTNYEMEKIAEYASYSLKIKESHLALEDLKMFYPPAEELKEKLTFSGEAKGTLPEINLETLTIKYGNQITLDALLNLQNYLQWETSSFLLKLKEFSITTEAIDEVMAFVSEEEPEPMPVNTGNIKLTGAISGTLPNLTLLADATTGRGSFHLQGKGGYILDTGASNFDITLNTEEFDIATLMADSIYGLVTVDLTAKGAISPQGNINAQGNFLLDRFDFNNYTYHDLTIEAFYRGDSISVAANSLDENIPMKLTALANVGSVSPNAQINLQMDSIFIDPLNFLDDYKETYLSGTITADIKGLDPEVMNLTFGIDDFILSTNKGSFEEPNLRLNYASENSGKKAFDVSSRLIKGNAAGAFTFNGLKESIIEAFPVLFEGVKVNPKDKDAFDQRLNFRFDLQNVNSLSGILQIDSEIPDSAVFIGSYKNEKDNLELLLSAYTEYMESDTIQVSLLASNQDTNLSLIINADNKSKLYDVDGSLNAEIKFIPVRGSIPDMDIILNPSMLVVNDTYFNINESFIEVREKAYSIDNFRIDHGINEYINLSGVVSENPEDSIKLNINQFQIGTLLGAMKTTDVPISGEATGKFVAKRLLTTPVFLTRDFQINNIVFADNDIGNLALRSGYSTRRNAIALKATLNHENRKESVISGFYLPERDSISLEATVRDIRLEWLEDMMEGTLYGMDGSANADIKVSGKLSNPTIKGYTYFDQAKIGISMLNVLYTTSDSIFIEPNEIDIHRFRLTDENNNSLTARGKITHNQFNNLKPNIRIGMRNFQVMNNAHQTDSLFYGNLKVNGGLTITESKGEWILGGNFSHAENSSIMINMPTMASTAQRHTSITFINSEGEDLDALAQEERVIETASFDFPMRMNLTVNLDESLKMGIVYLPASGDFAKVTGNGVISVDYDLTSSLMSLAGDYTIKSGKAIVSIAGITKKTFTVEEGGKVIFNGDPLATGVDIIAEYNLRADLTTLDEGFENLGMTTTRVPVRCTVAVDGRMDKMNDIKIIYDITLPNESEEIQRRFESLLYTDDDKILQLAYLLALGRFMPPDLSSSLSSNNTIGSLASTGLNALFSNVLSDNWSVDTNINAEDGNFDDMDVNISTNLFNNRLTLTSTLGYHNDQSQSFTGDFTIEYKLVATGNLVLKAYSVANNQYFEMAERTNGIGLVYKRTGKRFSDLFSSFGKQQQPMSPSRQPSRERSQEATPPKEEKPQEDTKETENKEQ